MRFDARFAQALKQPHSVNHARRTRDADYQFHQSQVLSTGCFVVSGPVP
jgi:hypothetical protein